MNISNTSFRQVALAIVILIQAYSASFGSDLPQQVQRLVDKRQEAISRIDKVFVDELEKIMTSYTKAGDLENANMVAELIKQAKGSARDKEFSLDGEWSHRNDGGDRSVVRRFKGKKLIDEHGVEHRFVFENDGITITWDSHQFEKIILDRGNPDVMKGVNSQGARFTYTRVK
jgi:hypothetical protein